MKHDTRGRRIVAPDPLIGFKRQSGRLESLTLTGSDLSFADGAALCATATGNFDVTTWGGQRVTIPWCAFKPLPVLAKTLHVAGTTAQGLFSGMGMGRGVSVLPAEISEPYYGTYIEQFHAMAVIAGNGFWVAIGYYPQALSNSGQIVLSELHATALSFGEF